MTKWNKTRYALSKLSGKPEDYFEILCDYIIIELCIKGLSVKDIANLVEEDYQSVQDTLRQYLGFSGFEERLAFSPLLWYTSLEDINDSLYTDNLLREIVEKYFILKERIESYGN